MEPIKPNALFYDGECPFCSKYSELIKARDQLGQFDIISLREDRESAQEFRNKGLNLEEGFVFRLDGKIYHGAKAMQILAKATQQNDPILRINHLLFSKYTLSKYVYPILRIGRLIALFFLKGSNRSKL